MGKDGPHVPGYCGHQVLGLGCQSQGCDGPGTKTTVPSAAGQCSPMEEHAAMEVGRLGLMLCAV